MDEKEELLFPVPIPEALVAELERRFPDRMPPLSVSDKEFGRQYGKVELVKLLRLWMSEQQESALS